MRIQKSDIIAGQPVFTLRKLLHYEDGTVTTIAEKLGINQEKAKEVFQTLCTEGYIKQTDSSSDKNDPSWENTIKGYGLVNATARKPITRKTAERLLQEFLQRVEKINSSDEYAYYVKRVILFGSYLSNKPTLGDIDLSLVLEYRDDDPEKRSKHLDERVELAEKQGRHFKSYFASLIWPHEEVMRFLKNRSPSISLHPEQHERVLSRAIPSKIIFDISET
jgi:predicted nucleotidyltransferase